MSGEPGGRWLIVAAGLHFRGGMDRANAALAMHLLRTGAEVHIVAHDVDDRLSVQPRARVHRVPRPLGSFALGEFGLDRYGRRIARELVGRDPSARVVVNGGNCRWGDINWVHYVHHAWRQVDERAPRWFRLKHRAFSARWRRAERAALGAARLVVANSELTRNHLLAHFDLPPERVCTVYLGAEDACASAEERAAARRWLQLPDDRPAVAFVGALGFDRRKGFDTLWAAWSALAAAGDWDPVLIVAGAGGAGSDLARSVSGAGLEDRVRLLGHTNRVHEVLAASDLLVSPVRYEPYGLNVQEALCRGVPALVSRSAGIAERFPAELEDMLLDDPCSVSELAGRLRVWRRQMGAWKRRVVPLGDMLRARSWDRMAAEIVAAAGNAHGGGGGLGPLEAR